MNGNMKGKCKAERGVGGESGRERVALWPYCLWEISSMRLFPHNAECDICMLNFSEEVTLAQLVKRGTAK